MLFEYLAYISLHACVHHIVCMPTGCAVLSVTLDLISILVLLQAAVE